MGTCTVCTVCQPWKLVTVAHSAESHGTGLGFCGVPRTGAGGAPSSQDWDLKRRDKERNSATPPIHLLHTGSDLSIQIWARNAAPRAASREKRVIKALSAKSKPASSSFEIKPFKYQRIPRETQGCPSGRTAGRGQLQELYGIRAIWTWFWLKRTLIHTGTQGDELTPHVNHLTCLKLTQF